MLRTAGHTAISSLGEAIILQAIEDLWSPCYRMESLAFLRGEGLGLCAKIACIDASGKLRLFRMLKAVMVDLPMN